MAKVLMYSTAVCPYCVRAEQLLTRKGVKDIEKVRVDLEPERRAEMMQKPASAPCRRSTSAKPMSAVATTSTNSTARASSIRCWRRRITILSPHP
jgi:glutaredoxin